MKLQAVGKNQDPKIAMCLYSIPGYGKTRFIGSGENVLIIRPPQDHTDSIREPAKRNIQEAIVDSWADMNEALIHAHEHGKDYEWIWLDSISLLQDATMDTIWADVVKENPHRARYGLDKQEYGINMHRLGLWVRQMAGIGTFNFGVTAHAFWGKNLDDDELLMPWVQGKNMPDKLCGSMNVVGYLDIKKIKLKGESEAKERRVIYFNGTDRYYAKDQFDAFPNGKLVDPTMPKFMKAIKAARAGDAAQTPKRRTGRKKKANA